MSVRVLEAKAIGLPSWMRGAPRPYSQASVCITMDLVLSNMQMWSSVMCCISIVLVSEMLHLCMGSIPSVILVLVKMWSWKLRLGGRVGVSSSGLKMIKSCFWFSGVGRSSKACTFAGSGFIPCAVNITP